MSARILRTVTAPLTAIAACAMIFTAMVTPEAAQAPSVASQPAAPQQGGRGRGRGPAGPPPPAQRSAPVDLVGNWVSVVTEDWQWRMRTPPKGDYASVAGVMTAAARKQADSWEPSMDGQCQAYGVGAIMRMPGRLRISWQDENTLKIETDAGSQTRLLRFTAPGAAAQTVSQIAAQPRTLQGYSAAEWVRTGAAFDAFLERGTGAPPPPWGSLKVVTTNTTGGWLRRNGVPYSENAVITENFTRFTNPDAGDWFVVTTIVEDPQNLTQPFITSSNFKKEADGAKFSPSACKG